MNPRIMKRLLIAAAGIGVAGLVVVAMLPAAVPVDVGTVTRGRLVATVDEEGQTRVRDIYMVSSPVAGRLLRLGHDVGDDVAAGETILARILPSDPSFLDVRTEAELQAELESSRASLRLAEADVQRRSAERDFAEAELMRTQALKARGNVSEAALDRRRMAYNTAIAAMHEAEAAVAVAQSQLRRSEAALMEPGDEVCGERRCLIEIASPANGRVLRLWQESEAVVQAGQGIIEVGDPRDLEIVVDLLSSEAVQVTDGAPVTIEGWGGASLRGRVRRVEPFGFTKVSALGVDEQRVNVIIDFVDDRQQWQNLGHGFRVDVRIEVWRGEDVLKVPASALFRMADGWGVFTVDNGRARFRGVEAGRFTPAAVEILSGLSAGEQVVLHPGVSVEDGVKLEIRDIS